MRNATRHNHKRHSVLSAWVVRQEPEGFHLTCGPPQCGVGPCCLELYVGEAQPRPAQEELEVRVLKVFEQSSVWETFHAGGASTWD